MNPFRSRKKSHDAGEPQRHSNEPEVPPLPSFASKTFKRSKKVPQETKPQVNIATALPSSDDFRTSLLMPNLSARFSMLREQDDPTSKIGKANDDSVLFPKRASRLNLFNRNELMDIAEVDSVQSSKRPTIKPWGTDSYGSFDSADDEGHGGGVMSRARPGEGNTMFGGRQKIYKIPVAGSGTLNSAHGNEDGEGGSKKGMSGRFLYGDDVSLSAFQKLREQEKAVTESKSERSSIEHEGSNSPALVDYNRYRETASSTTSAPSEPRTSTAATSVASQRSIYAGQGIPNGNPPGMPISAQVPSNGLNMDRQNLKSRRLYGQGLDQQIHEQQSSAMNRLESLHRQRGVGGLPLVKNLAQSRSATNLNERFQRSGPLYVSNEFRAASPPPGTPPSRLPDLDFHLPEEKPLATRNRSDLVFRQSPPLSPPVSPMQDPTLVAALEPNDVGKATASGAFHKPKMQYDEQEFLQRQLRLHQGRETPPSNRPLFPPALSIEEHSAGRTRENSLTSSQSGPPSLKHYHDQHSNDHTLAIVPENPGLGIKGRHAERHHADMGESSRIINPSDPNPQPRRESEQDKFSYPARYGEKFNVTAGNARPERPADMDHPIYRSYRPEHMNTPPPEFPPPEIPQNNGSKVPANPNAENAIIDVAKPIGFDADSPTLGPASGSNGVSGLVQTHVRNESESSVYPEDSPILASNFHLESYHEGNPLGIEPITRRTETFFHKESWDSESREKRRDETEEVEAMPPPLSIKARQILDQANALRNLEVLRAKQAAAGEKAQGALGGEPARTSQESSSSSSWRDQLKTQGHTRGGSTETAKEQENFANELAERRRMVRDNLKSFVEGESRSASPMPGSRHDSPSRQGAPFGLLKSKTSKSSLRAKNDQPSKAMKMLGMSVAPNNPSGSRSAHESTTGDESDQVAHHTGHDRKGLANPRQIQPGFQGQNYSQPQRRDQHHDRSQEKQQRKTSSPSSKSSIGEQSNVGSPERRSDSPPKGKTTGRSIYLADQMGYHSQVPRYRLQSNAPPTLPDPPPSTVTGRVRSNSRTNTATEYYEHRGPLAVQTSSSPNLGMPPPSAPASARSASSPYDVPSSTTPIMMKSSPSVNMGRVAPHRKRSIQKQDISDPMFVSSTSSVGTVSLPAGASLNNGMDQSYPGNAPPVPPFNPRRKRILTLRQALGRGEKPELSPSSAIRGNPYPERSNFSADEREEKPKPRQRLRKISSEGGNMNARARQHALGAPNSAVPSFPQNMAAAPSPATTSLQHPGVQRCPNEPAIPASPDMF